jgi:hypothetical protein
VSRSLESRLTRLEKRTPNLDGPWGFLQDRGFWEYVQAGPFNRAPQFVDRDHVKRQLCELKAKPSLSHWDACLRDDCKRWLEMYQA